MNKKRLLTQAILAAIAFSSTQAVAAGFQLNSQSATGLGRAFAGDAVIADNASAMARNPAAMALFKKRSVSVGVTMISTDVQVKGGTYNSAGLHLDGKATINGDIQYDDSLNPIGFTPSGAQLDKLTPSIASGKATIPQTQNLGGTNAVPNIYLINPINEQWAWGLAAYSNFGTGTEFKDNFVAPLFGGTTKVRSFNLGASVSYRLNEQFSFGAGLDAVYGVGQLHRSGTVSISGKLNVSINDSFWGELGNQDLAAKHTLSGQVLDADASGWGLGWNVGTVYEVNEDHRFGLSYRKSPTIKAKGNVFFLSSGKGMVENDTLHVPLPDMAEFSGYHNLTNAFAIHYSAQWIGWSKFDEVKSDAHGTIKKYNWKDSWHYALGATYLVNEDWTLRTGYMLDKSPVNELTSLSIPCSDRQWFSAGLTYHFTKDTNIDLGATYLMGEDVQVNEKLTEALPFPSVQATTRANAVLVGVQFSHTF